jgi:hypothetical protein
VKWGWEQLFYLVCQSYQFSFPRKNFPWITAKRFIGYFHHERKSNVTKIGENTVNLDQEGQTFELENHAVIICAGGILPTPFLKEIGVMVDTHHGLVKV